MKSTVNRLHMNFKKEPSLMQAIPPSNDALITLSRALDNLRACEDFKNISFPQQEMIQFEYENVKYKAFFYKDDVKLASMKVQHSFTDDETLRYRRTTTGLTISMLFTRDNIKSYEVQLKLLMTMVPSTVAIADYSSRSIISGRWARMQLSSPISIPVYMGSDSLLARIDMEIYSNNLWIHTHGMKRLIGFEIESDSIPNRVDSYPEFSIFEKCCEMLIKGDADLQENSLIHINDHITLLAEPSSEVYTSHNPEDYQRTRIHNRDENFYIHMLENRTDEVIKHPLSFCRSLSNDILEPLTKPDMQIFKELSLDRLPILKENIPTGTTFANVCDDNYKWIRIKNIQGDKFTGTLKDDDSTKEPSTFNVCDINSWVVYKDGKPIGPDDAYLLISDESPCTSLLMNHRDKFMKMLKEKLNQGESSTVADYIESMDTIDYDLILIYTKALLNMGYYSLSTYHLMREVFTGKDDSRWLTLMACANRMLYHDDKVKSTLDRALNIDPNDIHALSEMACLNINNEEYSSALTLINTIIKDKNFPSTFSKGEEETIYNMMDHCEYGMEEQDRLQRLRVCEMYFSGGSYKKVISSLSKEEEMYPKQRILYSKALLGLGQSETALNSLNMVDDEFKDEEWHRTAISIYDSLPDDFKGINSKDDLHDLRAKSIDYNRALFKEMHNTMLADERFLGIFTDPQNRLTLMVNLIDRLVLSSIRNFNKESKDFRLYQINLGDLLQSHLKESLGMDTIPEPQLDMDYNTLIFKVENTRDNAASLDKIADEIFRVFTSLSLQDVLNDIKEKPELLQHDSQRVYNLSDPDEYELFNFVVEDMFHAEAFTEQIKLFSKQELLPNDDIFAYVCALNNNCDYKEALSLITPFKSTHMDDDYFNYIYTYSLLGCREYDRLYEHLEKKSSFINNIPVDGDEDDLTIKAYCNLAEGNLQGVKDTLSKMNIEKPLQSFNLKHALYDLLDAHPHLREDFEQEQLIAKCENLVYDGNLEDARNLIRQKKITNKAAVGRLYHLLVMLDEYDLALEYLNMVDDDSRTDYWNYCMALCQVFSGDYKTGITSIEAIIPYLKQQKKVLSLSPKGTLVYAFACYILGDTSSCRLEILSLWDKDWACVNHLAKMLKDEYSIEITPSLVEEFTELKEFFL